MSPPQAGGANNSSGGGAFLVIALGVLGVVWLGAQLASILAGGHLSAGLAPTFHALTRLPANTAEPRLAWGPPWQDSLPGAALYWACTAFAAVVGAIAVASGLRVFGRGRIGTEDRRRLGVDTKARLATARDLRPLIVKGPVPGRLILGRVGRHLVANELRDPTQRARPGGRAGDRSAIAVIGPSRCGKSANIISAILENEGPAILSSVKGDLLSATIERRRQLGEVKIFDPTGVVKGYTRAQWSPVANCGDVTGAKKLASALASANPGNMPNDGFFGSMAEELLWPLLYTAAVSGATMGHVVSWVLGDEASIPDITNRLDPTLSGHDPIRRRHATMAMKILTDIWGKEARIRSSIYSTALTMVTSWEDPIVADCAITSEITMEWLVSGANTLYVCSPLHEQLRLATVFGGMLDDLLQQAYEWQNDHGSRLPDTLFVLDEAANTPARWLPQVASTCSGIGIQLVTIWQSKAQIDDAYRTLADSVLTNHGTKLFFSGISDPSTLDYVSRLLGDEEVLQRGSSNDLSFGRHSVNESATRLRLVPADILRQVPPGEGLLIHGTLRPAHLRGRFYYAERRLRALVGESAVMATAAALAPPPPPPASKEGAKFACAPTAPAPLAPIGPTIAPGLTVSRVGGPLEAPSGPVGPDPS
ncbi:MAG: hypothetical protein QOG43_137 [Actinomycetota bacterium]|jgi:type IV secretion system protein VirD4|nr:hypothetical protein [Actinomycetota bacterium]